MKYVHCRENESANNANIQCDELRVTLWHIPPFLMSNMIIVIII